MAITNGYATLAEIKQHLSMSTTTAAEDTELEDAVTTASRNIDEFCARRFYADASASTKVFRAHNAYHLKVDDVSTLTGLVVKTDTAGNGTYDQTLTITTDFIVDPPNAIGAGDPVVALRHVNGTWPTSSVRPRVEVTAKWGWPSVPAPVKRACLIEAARLYRRKDTPEGMAGVGEFGVVRISRFMDPDVERMLTPYRFPYGPLVA